MNEAVSLIYRLGESFNKKETGANSLKTENSYFVELLGFEPRQTEPKSVVLPLHHSSITVKNPIFQWECKNKG